MKTNNQSPASHVYYDDTIDSAVQNAFNAFEGYKKLPVTSRIALMEQIIAEIQANRGSLLSLAQKETALPGARLSGEIDRTINQIRMFIALLDDGSWKNAIIDTALPDRQPFPQPDLRQIQQPIGVVAVFGASNFPFAFSVAGSDTISALAAGCPVVYKVHDGHPETSMLTADCIVQAMSKTCIPEGVFAIVYTTSNESSIQIVNHPLLKAVAFTGSFAGGKALYSAASSRPEPIPVYAEMGSTNPVFILPGKLKESAEQIALTMVFSNTLGVGQFCTNPGLMTIIDSPETQKFAEAFKKHLSEAAGGKMLTGRIHRSYSNGISKLKAKPQLEFIGEGKNSGGDFEGVPHAFSVSGIDFLADEDLLEEYFGPTSIRVIASDQIELLEVAKRLPGQLTVTVWANQQDCEEFKELFHILEGKAGRLIINNAPTGVEVTHAMVHGGPYPATTDARTTSVGSTSIYRFTRPVCYQNFPEMLLPDELKDDNPLGIVRRINGEYTKEMKL